jgi:hypothetical protein
MNGDDRTRLLAIARVWIVAAIVLTGRPAWATDYAVKPDGTGQFTTIQACANAVTAGSRCLVYPGTYNEHVRTAAGGTSDSNRVTFKAQGAVTMRGFEIRHPYVTVDGFDMTGYTIEWDGLITIYSGGNACSIVNNTLHDGSPNVMGVYFYISSGLAASNCVVRNNRLTNLNYMFITTGGNNHLFEFNTLEYQNNMDFVRLFGSGHVFRRNVFRYAGLTNVSGNHPDFTQTFGQNDSPAENNLFEENWIGDLDSQLGQYNSGGIMTGVELYTNYRNVTFRRNIFVNITMNGNFAFPGVRFENNTFYRLSYTMSGLTFSGSLTRGDASNVVVKNNVFLEGGSTPTVVNENGYYSLEGALFSREVIGTFITNDPLQTSTTTNGIYSDLQVNGYIGPNGQILPAARALTNITQFVLAAQYSTYRQATYDRLTRTVTLDNSIRSTFSVNYNYVGGAASAGFPPKRSSGCNFQLTYTEWNFCESRGINGGNPGLRSLTNLLGPDGVPFTLDDGLKPLPTSALCGAGEGGTDIGAYSCATDKVFTNVVPRPPTNLRIVGLPDSDR